MRALVRALRCLLLLLVGLLLPHEDPELPEVRPQPSVAAPVALEGEDGEALREEFFVLELAPPDVSLELELLTAHPRELVDPQGRPAVTEVGLATCRRRGLGPTALVEWDVRFPQHDTRVLHVEGPAAEGQRKLVWRELRPGDGRTVTVERERSTASLEVREWAGPRLLRAAVEGGADCVFPLEVLERARRGELGVERLAVFDPLARTVEPLEPSEVRQGSPRATAGPPLRRVELTRPDGTLAARYLLRGEELLAFQWQGGGLRARRVPREELERRLRGAEAAPAPER